MWESARDCQVVWIPHLAILGDRTEMHIEQGSVTVLMQFDQSGSSGPVYS